MVGLAARAPPPFGTWPPGVLSNLSLSLRIPPGFDIAGRVGFRPSPPWRGVAPAPPSKCGCFEGVLRLLFAGRPKPELRLWGGRGRDVRDVTGVTRIYMHTVHHITSHHISRPARLPLLLLLLLLPLPLLLLFCCCCCCCSLLLLAGTRAGNAWHQHTWH